MARKFAHEEAYRGEKLLSQLASKQILLCGAGALGSNLADLLCRQGVTKLKVVDMDRVETHNINTQLYGDGDVGALKVNALKNRLFRDTGVEIETFDKELKADTIKKIIKTAPDLIVDTFDNTVSRKLLTDASKSGKIPCIHGGMFADYGEIVWNEEYTVPQQVAGAQDVCDYPLARNLVMFVVSILSEEIIDFCVASKPRKRSWSLTLKDLSIRQYR